MTAPSVAPVLSTPDTHIFEDPTPAVEPSSLPRLSDEQLYLTYEIKRTVKEIREGRWRRIALQFPDEMLVDAPRVYEGLAKGLREARAQQGATAVKEHEDAITQLETDVGKLEVKDDVKREVSEEKLFILADTSYGSCCVDEIAAEHVDAEVVVHYGRSCLSPTARLPVVYVYTTRRLDVDAVVESFGRTYEEKDLKVMFMADLPYQSYVADVTERLRAEGYSNVWKTEVVHDPSSLLPNRTVPDGITELKEWKLFHISEPATALLLTLESRVERIHMFPTDTPATDASPPKALQSSSAQVLRRRYALLTRVSTVDIFGILINTLSVKNYLHVVETVKAQIAAAGKKSYTFVVGKVNAAKVANFSEVGGWVVIGCWESSLLDSKEFYRPIITPFELQLALQGEGRIWTGEWRGDFEGILKQAEQNNASKQEDGDAEIEDADGNFDSEEESAPPEFDFRTGRYVSHSRPMARSTPRASKNSVANGSAKSSTSLIKRANGDVAQIGGVVSPGAEFLRTGRTWQGLGSDFDAPNNGDGLKGARMEEGRRGVARGYVVGEDSSRT